MKKPNVGDKVRVHNPGAFESKPHEGEVVNLLSAQFAYQRYVDGEKRGRFLCMFKEDWELIE